MNVNKLARLLTVMVILATVLSLNGMAANPAGKTVSSDLPVLKAYLLNQNPDPAKAGDMVEVRIRFQNTGGAGVDNLMVEFMPDYPFSLLTGEQKTQVIESLPNWPDEENSRTLTFKVRADRDATQGQYKITFRHSLDGGKVWVTDDFNLQVTTKEFAEIIYIDKTRIMPGKETEMTFTINNIGNAPLQNLIFYWNEPKGVVLPVSTDNTRYIKFLGPGERVPLKYTVIASVNANPELYELDLTLQYDTKNETGNPKKETIATKAGVFVGGETDFDVTFSESTQGQTSLSVANVGSNPALSVTVRVPPQEGFRVQGSTDAIVGNLDKGDYTIVSFQITPTSGSQNATDRGARRGNFSSLTPEERAQLRQKIASDQGGNLKVVIDYTDTTGVRQTLEKTVPIQFRAPSTGDNSGGTSSFGQRQTTSTWWTSPTAIASAIFVLVLAGVIVYYRRKIANASKARKPSER